MPQKPNAIYIMGGSGTAVISASAYGLIKRTFREYRNKIGTLFASVGGIRGAINEDITDIFKYLMDKGIDDSGQRLDALKFYATPVFRTSRYNPDEDKNPEQFDCKRLIDIFNTRNIQYVFLNGGNDTMEKALAIQEYAKNKGIKLSITGIPKTVDNDLLITHRCPGYASFAKQVAINTMSLDADTEAFSIPQSSIHGGPIREGGVAQVKVFMGRDEGWGAAASITGKLDDSYGPHAIVTKEGGFSQDAFLNRCQNAWDKYGRLFVVASEGVHDGSDYIANYLSVSAPTHNLVFKKHVDPHKNLSVTDSRIGLFLKLLLEKELKVSPEVYKDFKCREEGPDYLDRNNLEILSDIDFRDAIAVGEKAADLVFGKTNPIDGVMVTLTHKLNETNYTALENVADLQKDGKKMTKSIKILDTPESPILSSDGLMINRMLYMNYISSFIDLNGPNRSELLRRDGFELPLRRINWTLEKRLLPPYQRLKHE